MRVNITLEHKESGERLYLTSKNKRNTPDRLQLKKYSPKTSQTRCVYRSEVSIQYESIHKKNADFKRFFFFQFQYIFTIFQSKLYFFR